MYRRDPRNEREAYDAACARSQDLSRFTRWAMAQDATKVRQARAKPWSQDTDVRVAMASVAALFALGVIARVWG